MSSVWFRGRNFVRGLLAALSVAAVSVAATAGGQDRVNRSWNGLALKGYDPVAYFTEGRAAPGSTAFESEVGGSRYRFATAANRDAFAKDPGRYLPQYGGFCAYAVSRGYTADIDPEAWAVAGGKLYLNYSKRVRALWREDVPVNIQKADENWMKLRSSTR